MYENWNGAPERESTRTIKRVYRKLWQSKGKVWRQFLEILVNDMKYYNIEAYIINTRRAIQRYRSIGIYYRGEHEPTEITTYKQPLIITILPMKWDITYLQWKGFDANPQNINRSGRPRKQLSYIIEEIKEMWYKQPSQSEVIEICLVMLTFTADDLSIILNNEDYPMIMRIIATRMIWDRGFETVEKILDRWMGKPRQSTDIANNGDWCNPFSNMSTKELIQIVIKE